MRNSAQHIEVLQRAYDTFSAMAAEPEDALASVAGLYGLRVWAAAEQFFRLRWPQAESFEKRWREVKRWTTDVGESLNDEFAEAVGTLGVKALRHHPDYRTLRDDAIIQVVLMLDKLDASVENEQDVRELSRVLQHFLTRRVRNQAVPAVSLTTPAFLNTLGARLLTLDLEGERHSVYDPACGVGGSLVALHLQATASGAKAGDLSYYGQDVSEQAVFIAAWNLLLGGATHIHLEVGDSLKQPRFLEGGRLRRFDLAITQPPPNYATDVDFGFQDPYHRFAYGVVQSSRADYAFVQHVVASLQQPRGRACVVVPASSLSRSGFEEEIRASLIHASIVSASVSFQGSVLLNRNTPAGMLLFGFMGPENARDTVLFVDMPLENPQPPTETTLIRPSTVDHIAATVRSWRDIDGVSKAASLDEIQVRHYSLAPQAYVLVLGRRRKDMSELDEKLNAAEDELREAQETFRQALAGLRREHLSQGLFRKNR